MKKRVCILYTGGTIGMVPTELGYAPSKNIFQAFWTKFHDEKQRYAELGCRRIQSSAGLCQCCSRAVGQHRKRNPRQVQ